MLVQIPDNEITKVHGFPYSFDEKSKIVNTQLMRLVEDDRQARYGKIEQMDDKKIDLR